MLRRGGQSASTEALIEVSADISGASEMQSGRGGLADICNDESLKERFISGASRKG